MQLFDLTKIMFEDPQAYTKITPGEKRKHFFMINRRMSIQFPLQAHVLQHIKINEEGVVDFWQHLLRKKYTKTPYWMFTKGVKKAAEIKEKNVDIKRSVVIQYASKMGFDLKSVQEAADFFPEELKKELQKFEKWSN